MRGCLQHGIALLMKDIFSFKPAIKRSAAIRSFDRKLAESCVEDGNKIVKSLRDSRAARQLVAEKQEKVMHSRRPACQRGQQIILFLRSSCTLARPCNWPQYPRRGKSCLTAANPAKCVTSGCRFSSDKTLRKLFELLHAFADAVHQLEGDKPHLAECHQALVVPPKLLRTVLRNA
jgi:hypothetical protein